MASTQQIDLFANLRQQFARLGSEQGTRATIFRARASDSQQVNPELLAIYNQLETLLTVANKGAWHVKDELLIDVRMILAKIVSQFQNIRTQPVSIR